ESSCNVGVFHNFERGFCIAKEAGAALIFPCDQDDVWVPWKMEKIIDRFKTMNALLIYSDAFIIDDKSNILSNSLFHFEGRIKSPVTTNQLLLRNVVTGCCSAFKAELLRQALPFPAQGKKIKFHHDLWLALVAANE